LGNALSIYEQPLNERVRALLRLEFLFEQADYLMSGNNAWDSRATLNTLIEVMALMGRADLKTEIIKELERQGALLEPLYDKQGVDNERLDDIMGSIRQLLVELRSPEGTAGQEFRNNELIAAVKQRASMPAGTLSFDIPMYQYWLERAPDERRDELEAWFQPFEPVKRGVNLCLTLIRQSSNGRRETAVNGFFQQSLDAGVSCQMVRVLVDSDAGCFPEVSGGRHRFTVRFMELPVSAGRPAQAGRDIDFELQCCVI